jgi:7-cyano-7-deazaguanine synthase
MARELALVLANGSVQSTVAATLAAQKYRPVMVYAEPEASVGRPGQAFDALVQQLKPYRSHRVPMHFLATQSRGGVTPDSKELRGADSRSGELIIARLVDLMPIVAAALRYAIHYNAVALYLGTRVGPDGADLARVTEFGQLWTEMVQLTCERSGLEVVMPLLELEPWQVVDLGAQVNAPLALTWSCEKRAGDPCGECVGCREREQAFQRAGRPDPAKSPAAKAAV